MTDAQKKRFEETLELDLSFGVKGLGALPRNLFEQHGAVGAVPPDPLEDPASRSSGCRGCSQSPSSRGSRARDGPDRQRQVDDARRDGRPHQPDPQTHILTIEDPVEFIHADKGCLVNQRDVRFTRRLPAALRAALREDPDVILIGEMRDQETIAAALSAETATWFGTLHTNSAAKTINRIIDIFPTTSSPRSARSCPSCSRVVCQHLLKNTDDKGRAAAIEILVPTSPVGF